MRGSIYRDGARWAFVVDVGQSHDGRRRQHRRRGFATKREAESVLAEVQSQVRTGVYVEPTRLTVRDYLLTTWLPAIRASVRASTWDSYRRNIDGHILPRLGTRPLQSLMAADLNALYADLLTTLSSKTVRYDHTIVRKALADALRWNLVVRNVADAAEPPKPRAAGDAQLRTWSPAQVRAFLEHVQGDRLLAAWTLAATTGMRRGEVLGLRWSDVDLDMRRLSVRQTLVSVAYEVQFSTPKSGKSRRSVPLDPHTVSVLRTWRAGQVAERLATGPLWVDTGLVFTSEDGSWLHPQGFTDRFDSLVKTSGLPRIRLHDLRHTAATIALERGVPVKAVSEMLGHATPGFTMAVYQHVTSEIAEQATGTLAAAIFGVTNP